MVGWSAAAEKRQEGALCRDIVGRLVALKCPLLLGTIDPSKIIGARVHRNDRMGLNEIRNGYSEKQEYYRDSNEDVLRCSRHNV